MPYAPSGDVQIYFETFGDRNDPPLLLINGLGSQCINYRPEWCQRFVDRGFFVIRFDNRDVGLSTKFDHVTPSLGAVAHALKEGRAPDVPYVLADMASDCVAVLDALGIDQSHAMGLSMGGMIVQQLAIDHPDRLLSMTSVMSTTGDPDVGQASPEAFAALTGPPATDRDSAIAKHLAGNRIYGSPAHFDAQALTQVAGEAFDRCFNPAGVARQMQAVMASPSRSAALGEVRIPTLVLHGDADTLVDITGGRRTAERIPGARFVTMEGMGHDYPTAYWDQWVDLVGTHASVGI
jgi:pimeloyl-ACP methyl ester carboxylesterase